MAEIEATYTTRVNTALWIQPDGGGTRSYYLGCHNLDDFDEDTGSVTLLQCFDPKNPGQWATVGNTVSPPPPIDLSLGTYTGRTKDWLEKVNCPFNIYVLYRCDGKAGVFGNFERVLALRVARKNSRGRQGNSKMNEDVAAMLTFGVQASPPTLDFFLLSGYRKTVAETENALAIAFCNEQRCAGPCGGSLDGCLEGYIGTEAQAGSPTNVANVLKTTDGGDNWAATAANPFAAGEDVSAVKCFQITNDITRLIVARGTTDAGAAAEIAYSDDGGATWVNVTLGSTLGDFIPNSNSLFALDYYNIWAGTNDGFVYKSENGGATWVAQESGTITANPINAVYFINENYGFFAGSSDIVAKTVDGGSTWQAVTATGGGGDLKTIHAFNKSRIQTGGSDGDLYQSLDGGTTWSVIGGWIGSGTGAIADIKYSNELFGAMAHNVGAVGNTLMTFDGGYTWTELDMPVTTALNSVFMCASDLVWAAGDATSGTATVLKFITA